MSLIILQWTGSPTSTGTMWLALSMTGRPAARNMAFRVAARSWWISRTSGCCFSQRTLAKAPAVKAVESLQFARGHLSPAQHDKLRAAWRKAVSDALGEAGLFLDERKG